MQPSTAYLGIAMIHMRKPIDDRGIWFVASNRATALANFQKRLPYVALRDIVCTGNAFLAYARRLHGVLLLTHSSAVLKNSMPAALQAVWGESLLHNPLSRAVLSVSNTATLYLTTVIITLAILVNLLGW
jgi:hypothetical protein